jgi:hypothetical protein
MEHAKDVVRGIEMNLRQENLFNWFGEEANDRGQGLLQLTVVMTKLHWRFKHS